MVDKEFKINEECKAFCHNKLLKLKEIAKLQILVKQVIGSTKCFRILSQELLIYSLNHVNDIVIVQP